MARQIEYDPVALRGNLLSVFWEKGYAESSLSELEHASGLNRRQLYNGVGDKRAMFLQALDDFSEMAGREFLSALEGPDAGLKEIAALLNQFVAFVRSGAKSNGCMVCSSSQEEIAADPDVRPRIDAYFDRIRNAYKTALLQAVQRQESQIPLSEVNGRAEVLFGVHVALCVLARAGQSAVELEKMVQQVLRGIE